MTWSAQRHDLAPTLVGVELEDPLVPAGEAGHTDHGLTARFDLMGARELGVVPRLTALWVSTVGRDDNTDAILRSVPALAAALDAAEDEPRNIEPDPGDIVPSMDEVLLREMALTAVENEVRRLFPIGVDAERATWQRAPVESLGEVAAHPVAEVRGDATVFPLWWGGVSEDIARANPTLALSAGLVEVVELPAAIEEDLLVRVVSEIDEPSTVALALVQDGRADLSDVGLPERFRIELIDSTLRPVMSRADYLYSIARQWAFVGVAMHRAEETTLGNPWWEAAAEVYVQEHLARPDAEGQLSLEARACRGAVRRT